MFLRSTLLPSKSQVDFDFSFFFFQNSCCFGKLPVLYCVLRDLLFCIERMELHQQNKLLKMSIYTRFPRLLDRKASTIKDSISWVQGITLGPHRAFLPWVNSVVLTTQLSSTFLSRKKM